MNELKKVFEKMTVEELKNARKYIVMKLEEKNQYYKNYLISIDLIDKIVFERLKR